MEYEQLKLENQLCFPFYAVSRLIIRAYQEDLDQLGITYPQYLVMMVLWENNPLTVNEIGEKLILNTNTVTPLLKRMETMGLINRIQSESDQRKVVVSLTKKGQAMQVQAAEIPVRLLQKIQFDSSTSNMDEMIVLKNQLYKLIKMFKDIG